MRVKYLVPIFKLPADLLTVALAFDQQQDAIVARGWIAALFRWRAPCCHGGMSHRVYRLLRLFSRFSSASLAIGFCRTVEAPYSTERLLAS